MRCVAGGTSMFTTASGSANVLGGNLQNASTGLELLGVSFGSIPTLTKSYGAYGPVYLLLRLSSMQLLLQSCFR